MDALVFGHGVVSAAPAAHLKPPHVSLGMARMHLLSCWFSPFHRTVRRSVSSRDVVWGMALHRSDGAHSDTAVQRASGQSTASAC